MSYPRPVGRKSRRTEGVAIRKGYLAPDLSRSLGSTLIYNFCESGCLYTGIAVRERTPRRGSNPARTCAIYMARRRRAEIFALPATSQ
jgi:hypothetical protein